MARIPAQLQANGNIHFWLDYKAANATEVDYEWATKALAQKFQLTQDFNKEKDKLVAQIEEAKQETQDQRELVAQLQEALKNVYQPASEAKETTP